MKKGLFVICMAALFATSCTFDGVQGFIEMDLVHLSDFLFERHLAQQIFYKTIFFGG